MSSVDARSLGDCILSHTATSAVVSGFDNVAQDYEKVRPDYPQEALTVFFRNLFMNPNSAICDLACGTGKLTKELYGRGYTNVTAIDPADDMVAKCAQFVPGASVKKGTAEAIPAADSSFSTLVVGTAFHWFDGVKTLNEIARVLAIGGRVGLIWNMLNPEVSWVHKLRSLLESSDAPNKNHDTVKWKKAFEYDSRFSLLEHQVYHYTLKASPNAVIDCILSFKAAGNMTPEQIEKIKQQAFQILADDSRTANKRELDVPFRVEMYWTSKTKEATRSYIDLPKESTPFALPAFRSEQELDTLPQDGTLIALSQNPKKRVAKEEEGDCAEAKQARVSSYSSASPSPA